MNVEKMKEMINLQIQANVEVMDYGKPTQETLDKIEAIAVNLNIMEHMMIVKVLEEVFSNVDIVEVV